MDKDKKFINLKTVWNNYGKSISNRRCGIYRI